MYYVNESFIQERLACIPDIAEALTESTRSWQGTLAEGLVQERALHLAAEIVTDIGNAIIDGFIMRDPSSYEDIIDIMAMEHVIDVSVSQPLRELVLLRKSLVQDYVQWPRDELHRLTPELPGLLRDFVGQVEAYLAKELRG